MWFTTNEEEQNSKNRIERHYLKRIGHLVIGKEQRGLVERGLVTYWLEKDT